MKKLLILMTGAVIFFAACGKSSSGPGTPEDPSIKHLPGSIYYQWADEGVYQYNFASLDRRLLFPDDLARNSWDVSADQKLILECSDVPGDYEASQFTLINRATGNTVKQFTYYATEGDIATGSLSPDGQMIAINPTFHDGIVVVDLEGNIIQQILTVNNEKITEPPVWTPANTLLFPFKNLLLETNNTFSDVHIIKQFDFASWRKPAISKDGKKISLEAANHIWLMQADGTDLKQVTNSAGAETNLAFSPDGKHLLIGTDYHTSGPFGKIFYLKVIPADGRQYQVDDGGESAGVIPIIAPGEKQIEPADSKAIWR